MNDLKVSDSASSSVSSVDTARAVDQARTAFLMAKTHPRDEAQSLNRIREACQRTALAQVALYRYPRGGQNVTGPSIRLAEVLARYWGNIDCGVRELEQRGHESVMEAFCHDLETNFRRSIVWTVRHEMHTRSGVRTLTDPRDVYERIANDASRRLRACILSVIPSHISDEAVGECARTLQSGGRERPLIDRIRAMVQAFAALGVSREMLERRLQCEITALTPDQLVECIGIYTSLSDRTSKKEDWFPVEAHAPLGLSENTQ